MHSTPSSIAFLLLNNLMSEVCIILFDSLLSFNVTYISAQSFRIIYSKILKSPKIGFKYSRLEYCRLDFTFQCYYKLIITVIYILSIGRKCVRILVL